MATYTDINPRISNENLLGYDIETDEDAIKNSLLNIFTISKGDVPGKPDFGNPLNLTLFDLFDYYSQKEMEASISNIVERYEPRIKIESIDILEAAEFNRIVIQLNYSYVSKDIINYNSLELPYSHNSVSFLGGRVRPPQRTSVIGTCVSNK